jgi:transposase
MARACSQDLRDRVIDKGTSARAAAERFGIGVATAIVWVCGLVRANAELARKASRGRSKLDPHRSYLLGLIAAEPDVTIAKIQEGLRREAGVSASAGTIWTFLDWAGLTFKRPPMRASRTVGHPEPPRRVVRKPA